jgi:hypothetical protein
VVQRKHRPWNFSHKDLNSSHKEFKSFAFKVLAHIPMRVILVALVYIKRAQPHLHIDVDKEDLNFELVFLGALMAAYKACSPINCGELSMF